MTYFICKTCGVQYEASAAPPAHCPICEDERQYLPEGGQAWTTLAELQRNHQPIFREEEPNLLGIGTEPRFAIGQRMQLIQSTQGNVLWECMSLINDEAVAKVKSLGQVSAMSMSHPHFFSSIIEWIAEPGCRSVVDADDAIGCLRRAAVRRGWLKRGRY